MSHVTFRVKNDTIHLIKYKAYLIMVKTVPEFDASKVHFYPLVSDDSTHLVVQKTTDQQVMDKLFVHPELQYIKILVFRQHKRYILLESALPLLYENPQQALKAKEYYLVSKIMGSVLVDETYMNNEKVGVIQTDDRVDTSATGFMTDVQIRDSKVFTVDESLKASYTDDDLFWSLL
ncbi:hypothetical protein HDV02_005605 [Globomyces sp. JEL0801]|nr:hypothetical protein HDV02_005605 [Globomyces sp. JEL0801]